MVAKVLVRSLMLFAFLVKPLLSSPEHAAERTLTKENLQSSLFSSDGSVQVIVKEQGHVEILETATGRTVADVVVSHEYIDSNQGFHRLRNVSAVAISSDDQHVAFLNLLGKIQIHELRSGKIVNELIIADRVSLLLGASLLSPQNCEFKFSPDGKLLALCIPGVGNPDTGIWGYGVVFDLENETELYIERGLCAVADTKEGTFLGVRQSNQDTKTPQLWNLELNQPIRDFEGEYDFEILHGAFSPDGKLFMAGGVGKLRLWQTETGKLLLDIPLGKKAVVEHGLAISADNRQAVVSILDYEGETRVCRVSAWQIPEGNVDWSNSINLADIPVTAPFMLPDQQHVGIKLLSSSFRIWNLKSGKPAK